MGRRMPCPHIFCSVDEFVTPYSQKAPYDINSLESAIGNTSIQRTFCKCLLSAMNLNSLRTIGTILYGLGTMRLHKLYLFSFVFLCLRYDKLVSLDNV